MMGTPSGEPNLAAIPPAAIVAPVSPPAEILIHSSDLLRGGRVAVILHRGMKYRLLETKQGKLILNK